MGRSGRDTLLEVHVQMNRPAPFLSIVLPCYNEAQGLERILESFSAYASDPFEQSSHNHTPPFELILVDNGSTDNTQARLSMLLTHYSFARVVTIENNQGYGHGLYTGLLEAKGDVLSWSHADLQTDPGDIFKAYALYTKSSAPENTMVKGVRHGRCLSENIVSKGMQFVALLLLRQWIVEINAQPKVFHRNLLTNITAPPKDFNFDLYVLHKAKKLNYTIKTVHVQFPPRQYGQSNWSSTWQSKINTIYQSMLFMFNLGTGAWK